MVVRYIDAGYVKDDEAANWDADALMAAIKEGTDEDNQRRQAQGFPRWSFAAGRRSPITIRRQTKWCGRSPRRNVNRWG